jgi:glutamyl-tRNA synthetase
MTASAPIVRFAPSPTGYLHIGNARPCLLNWLHALKSGGRFILRIDDTDRERSKPDFEQAIIEDLAWLGITPHGFFRQSERFALYEAAAEKLRGMGRLYACYETPDELDRRRKRQLARGLPPVYDRAALKLTQEERAKLEAEGRKPHWRFLLEPGTVVWDDLVRGPTHIEANSLSDPVLIREDGAFLYTLPSVVDDIEMGITDVIRGEDHVTNTGVQIEIIRALGAQPPRFGHHNLLTTMGGEGLSKRTGALSLRSLREAGCEPLAVAALAVLTGSSEAVRPVASLEELAGLIDLAHLSRAPARFDEAELSALSARTLHHMDFQAVAPRLAAYGIDCNETLWLAVRGNISRLEDVAAWVGVVTGVLAPAASGPVVDAAREALPPEPWDSTTWKALTEAVKAATGAKGRELFMPLRLALTGLEHGPELAALLPLIGRERALKRLSGQAG